MRQIAFCQRIEQLVFDLGQIRPGEATDGNRGFFGQRAPQIILQNIVYRSRPHHIVVFLDQVILFQAPQQGEVFVDAQVSHTDDGRLKHARSSRRGDGIQRHVVGVPQFLVDHAPDEHIVAVAEHRQRRGRRVGRFSQLGDRTHVEHEWLFERHNDPAAFFGVMGIVAGRIVRIDVIDGAAAGAAFIGLEAGKIERLEQPQQHFFGRCRTGLAVA